MKTIRISAALLTLGLAGALASPVSAGSATKTVAFKANYTGTASLLIENSAVKILAVNGNGTGTLIGAGTVSGTGAGTGANGLCVPFKGKGSMTGSAATINFSVNASGSQGCSSGQSGPVTVAVNGTAKVTGGSGKAAGAKGSLTFKGTLKLNDTTGNQTGTFTGKLTGQLTVNK